MKKLFQLNPITRKRLQRFRQIKRGYYSLLALAILTVLSFFAEFIANSRAIVVYYNGSYYFPTYKFYQKDKFGQEDSWGINDSECDYRLLKRQFQWAYQAKEQREADYKKLGIDECDWESIEKSIAQQGKGNWVLMPFVPYNWKENDDSYPPDRKPPYAPDEKHILGTDQQARDVFARLLYGFRISILFSVTLTAAGLVIGTVIGCLQGYLAGRFDLFSQRLIEIWSTLPRLYIIVILGIFFMPNFWMLLGILVLFEWMGITYYMRTETYREKSREYCQAAKAMGAGSARIVFKHLLPNCLTPLVTYAPFMVVGGIFALTSLDYLGYGLPPPTPSWGEMIDQAMQSANRGKLWLILAPFLAISITLTLVVLIGESVREAFDPKKYSRYE